MVENPGYSAVDQIGNKKNKRHVVTGAVQEIAVFHHTVSSIPDSSP